MRPQSTSCFPIWTRLPLGWSKQDDLHGVGVTEAWKRALSQLGKTSREMTQTLFGRRLGTSKRWEKVQLAGGVRVISARGQTPPTAARRPSLFPVD